MLYKLSNLLIFLAFAFGCGGKKGESPSDPGLMEGESDTLPSSSSEPWIEPYSGVMVPESSPSAMEKPSSVKPAANLPPVVALPPALPPVLEIISPMAQFETTLPNQQIHGVCETDLQIYVSYVSGFVGPSSIACIEGLFTLNVIITGVSGTIVNRTLTLKQEFDPTRSTSRTLNFRFGTIDAPSKISMDGPGGVEVGTCAPFNVISRNLSNYDSPVESDEVVRFAVNNGTGSFYSDSLCTITITSSLLLQGQSSTTVYFSSNTNPQDLTILLTGSNLSQGTFTVAVGGESSSLIIEASPLYETTQCGGAIVRRIDAFGVAIANDSTATVNLVQNGSLQFYSDGSCQTPVSSIEILAFVDSASFYFLNSEVETVSISAIDSDGALATANLDIRFALSKPWGLEDFEYRTRITIRNSDQSQAFTNMPVLIKLTPSRINYSHVLENGFDLRFLASDDLTPLSYEIESWNSFGDSYIWVKVDHIAGSTNNNFIYMYYGNNAALSDQNPSSTFSEFWSIWHLGEDPEGGGPQFRDSTANARHAASSAVRPVTTTAVIGRGLELNGNFDTITSSANLSSVLGASSTFSCWMKTSMTGDNTMWRAPGITGVEQAGGANDIFFGWIDANGYIGVTAGNGAEAKSNFVVNDNQWRYVTISRNHLSGAVRFYVNGVLNGSGTSEAGLKTTPFYDIGVIGDTGSTPQEFDGSLDEIRIVDKVLSSDRIKAEFKYLNDTHVDYAREETKSL